MRSRRLEMRRRLLPAAVLALALNAAAQDVAPAPAASAPAAAASRAAAVAAAASALRADPLLSGKHMTHVLKWKDEDEPRKKEKPLDNGLLAWLRSFARFLNDTS